MTAISSSPTLSLHSSSRSFVACPVFFCLLIPRSLLFWRCGYRRLSAGLYVQPISISAFVSSQTVAACRSTYQYSSSFKIWFGTKSMFNFSTHATYYATTTTDNSPKNLEKNKKIALFATTFSYENTQQAGLFLVFFTL